MAHSENGKTKGQARKDVNHVAGLSCLFLFSEIAAARDWSWTGAVACGEERTSIQIGYVHRYVAAICLERKAPTDADGKHRLPDSRTILLWSY